MYVIVHLVIMAEHAQYLDVVTRVPVEMDTLEINVKVHLIFVLLCVLSVNKNKLKDHGVIINVMSVLFQFKSMLCLSSNSCCALVQINAVSEFNCKLS